MKTRRQLLVGLGAALLAAPFRSFAQQPGKVWRVGFLSPAHRPADLAADYYGAFPKRMGELGYVEGKNLVIEWRFAELKYERLPELAAELVRMKVDVLLADRETGAFAARKATKTIPIVFFSGDPVGSGLVESFSKPGGNLTGVSTFEREMHGKQLEILAKLVPGLSLIGVLVNPDNPGSAPLLKSLQEGARHLKLELLPLEVRTEAAMVEAFDVMTKKKAGAFTFIADSLMRDLKGRMVELELAHRLPGHGWPRFGGLFYYGTNVWDIYRRAANQVDKILKGANPGELPIEQTMKFELVFNRKTANALGVEIPPDLLLLADEVIE